LTTQQTPAVLLTQAFDEMNFTTDPDTHHVLRAGTPQSTGVLQAQAFQQNQRDEVRLMGDQAGALAANAGVHQQNYLAIPQAFRKSARAQSVEDDESWVADGQANTLNTFDLGETRTTHAIVEEMVDFGRTSDRIRLNAQTAATLQSGGGGAGANTGLYMAEYAADETGTLQARTYKGLNHENVRDGQAVVQSLSPSLTASNDPSRSPQSSEVTQQVAAVHASGYGVRRLTPVECERLQAFPDGWTEPAVSDSARYKALGNAVTVNTVRWVLGRMLEQS
jgi:site-specific DNA-cytosine methylase